MKRMFRLFAVGFFVAVLAATGLSDDGRGWGSVLTTVAFAVLVLFFIGRSIWGLADEVHDGGSFLIVRRGEAEQRVYLNDIESIDHEAVFVPPRIRITCRTPGDLGRKIRFLANDFDSMIATPPLVTELRERVERVRGAGT